MEVVKNTDKKRAPTGWAEFGSRIKSIRERRGMTRDAIANGTSVDATSMWRIETGNQWVSPQSLRELSEILRVPVSEFFEDKEKEAEKGPENDETREYLLGRIVLALGGLDQDQLRGVLQAVELAVRQSSRIKRVDLEKQGS